MTSISESYDGDLLAALGKEGIEVHSTPDGDHRIDLPDGGAICVAWEPAQTGGRCVWWNGTVYGPEGAEEATLNGGDLEDLLGEIRSRVRPS